MKKILFSTFALFLGLLVMTSCNKNQRAVKDLAGTWTVTDQTYDGVSVPKEEFEGTTYTFNECKVKKEDCTGSLTYNDPLKGSQTTAFTYSVSDKGETITMNMSFMGETETTVGDIEELTDSKFVFSSNEDGTEIVTTMTK
ncbi:MAG: lipocalin family protein [Salibacteraceae bacterium]